MLSIQASGYSNVVARSVRRNCWTATRSWSRSVRPLMTMPPRSSGTIPCARLTTATTTTATTTTLTTAGENHENRWPSIADRNRVCAKPQKGTTTTTSSSSSTTVSLLSSSSSPLLVSSSSFHAPASRQRQSLLHSCDTYRWTATTTATTTTAAPSVSFVSVLPLTKRCSRSSRRTSGPRQRWTRLASGRADHRRHHSYDYSSLHHSVFSGAASQAFQQPPPQSLWYSTDATNPPRQQPNKETETTTTTTTTSSTTTSPPRPSAPASPHVYRTLGTTKVPTPQFSPPEPETPLASLAKATPKGLLRKGLDLVVHIFQTSVVFLFKLPSHIYFYATHPDELQQKWDALRQSARDEIHHYWVGAKLMWADLQTARGLVSRMLQGSTLTRRERKQLLRTTSDLFRLIPFSMFIIIPFMEFALPFALRLFPNLLPSTFQDSLKAEEAMKREVQSRIAMTQFFQE